MSTGFRDVLFPFLQSARAPKFSQTNGRVMAELKMMSVWPLRSVAFGRARGVRGSWRRGVPKILFAADARQQVRDQNTFLVFSYLARVT